VKAAALRGVTRGVVIAVAPFMIRNDRLRGRLAAGVLVASLLAATPCAAVTWEEAAPGVNGFTTVDRITWRDSKGLERELFFARAYPNSIVPQLMGYVTRLTWQPSASASRIVAEEDPSAINASNASGWGTTVLHMHWLQYGGVNPYFGDGFSATTNKRDGFDFVQGPRFLGPHHLIFRVTYKQYTTLLKGSTDTRKFVYVTIDWFISDGLDHVVYALTLDASRDYSSDSVAFLNNSLAPYSLDAPASWKSTTDWAGGRDGPDGQGFGDQKRFVTTDMRHWTYGDPNAVPYVWQWVSPVSGRGDAEAGYVQTETYAQKPAGEGFAQGQSGSGASLPVYPDQQGFEYSFQMNYFDNYQSKRLTWGTRFGVLYGGAGSSPGFENYSLALHLGTFSDRGVPALIAETEALHDGTISVRALAGQLRTQGPEGSGNATPHTFSPPGFNAVYRTWELDAQNDAATIAFDVGAGSYRRPVFVLRGASGTALGDVKVTLNGNVLASSGFGASLDAATHTLYVTLLSTLSGNNVVELSSHAGASPPPPAPDAGRLDAGTTDAGRLDAGACVLGDGDGDGVCDDVDNCTGCYDPTQLDADHDGLGDCWRCDWCSGPGTDTDYDGFCDALDDCALVWNQSQNDADRDGVGDACDNCPDVANPAQTDANANGLGDACEGPAASCSDRQKNGSETDVDCGGSACAGCARLLRCASTRDCASGLTCRSGRCR
jgi:hypothetical protein